MRFLAFVTATLLLAAPHIALSNGQQRITPEEARILASTALVRGDLAVAAQISDALIEGDSEDAEALLIRAAVALEAGRYDLSQRAAQQAWSAAESSSVRHHAALLRAQALEAKGQYFQAELWLRRSLQLAPNAVAEAEARRAYRAVRKNNPWKAELGFGIAPTSNVNNGTAAETVELFGLDFEISESAQALSGFETFTQARLSRRLSFGARYRTDLVVSSQLERYWLSDKSREAAPDLDVAELSYENVSVGLKHQQVFHGNLEIDGLVGVIRSWRGGGRYSDQLKFGSEFIVSMQKGTALVAETEVSQEWLNDSDDNRVLRMSGALGLRKLLPKHVVWSEVGVNAVQSDRESLAYQSHSLRAGVEFKDPVLTARLAAAVGAEWRRYTSLWHSGAERDDNVFSFTLRTVFTELEQYGFSPQIDFTVQHRDSTIDFFDQNAIGMRLGIQSTF